MQALIFRPPVHKAGSLPPEITDLESDSREVRCLTCGPLANLAFDELRNAVVCLRCKRVSGCPDTTGQSYCSNCKHFTFVVEDASVGHSVCRNCGLVHERVLLSYDAPMQYETQKTLPCTGKGDTPAVPWQINSDVATTTVMAGEGHEMYSASSKMIDKEAIGRARTQRFKFGLADMDRLCIRLGVGTAVRGRAEELWAALFRKEVETGHMLHGRKTLSAAVLLIASVDKRVPIYMGRVVQILSCTGPPEKETAEEAAQRETEMRRQYMAARRRQLQRALKREDVSDVMRNPLLVFEHPYTKQERLLKNALKRIRKQLSLPVPSLYEMVIAYCSGFVASKRYPPKVAESCESLVNRYREAAELQSRSSASSTRTSARAFAASFLYLACKQMHLQCSQKSLSRLCDTQSNVISRGCARICKVLPDVG